MILVHVSFYCINLNYRVNTLSWREKKIEQFSANRNDSMHNNVNTNVGINGRSCINDSTNGIRNH